jgi:hypothetical protein
MCEIVQRKQYRPDGRFDLFLTCKKTGKPIDVTNEFGMFCKDLCDLEANKLAKEHAMKMIRDMLPPELREEDCGPWTCIACKMVSDDEDDFVTCAICDDYVCLKCARFKQYQGWEEAFCPKHRRKEKRNVDS